MRKGVLLKWSIKLNISQVFSALTWMCNSVKSVRFTWGQSIQWRWDLVAHNESVRSIGAHNDDFICCSSKTFIVSLSLIVEYALVFCECYLIYLFVEIGGNIFLRGRNIVGKKTRESSKKGHHKRQVRE